MSTTFLRSASRCLAVSALLLAMGQPAAWAGGDHRPFKRITGVWSARVNITNCLPGTTTPGPVVFASFDALNVYAADGTFLDTNSSDPTTQSAHFGYWRQIRGNRYEFAQKFFLLHRDRGDSGQLPHRPSRSAAGPHRHELHFRRVRADLRCGRDVTGDRLLDLVGSALRLAAHARGRRGRPRATWTHYVGDSTDES